MPAESESAPDGDAGPPSEAARASVVLVTMDDPRVLDCLDSVLAQQTPFDYDVHLVGEWTEPEIPRRIEERFGDEPRLTVSTTTAPFMEAWNGAAQATDGEIVVRLDSDTVAEPGWLAALVAPLLDDDRVGWTAGKVLGPEEPSSPTQGYFHHRALGYFQRQAEDGAVIESAPGWNVAYRREGLEQVDWYDVSMISSEDWDLHKRLTEAGYPGRLVPDAVVRHDHPDRLRDLASKEFWYKTGQVHMAHKHGLADTWTVFQIPVAYGGLIVLGLGGFFAWQLAALAGIAWVLLAVKQMIGGLRGGDAVWWGRPIYRVFEGVGGLAGLLRGLIKHGIPPLRAPGPTSPRA